MVKIGGGKKWNPDGLLAISPFLFMVIHTCAMFKNWVNYSIYHIGGWSSILWSICPIYRKGFIVIGCWQHTPCMAHIYMVLSDCTHHCWFVQRFLPLDTGTMTIHLEFVAVIHGWYPGICRNPTPMNIARWAPRGEQKKKCSPVAGDILHIAQLYPVVKICCSEVSGQDSYAFPCQGLNIHQLFIYVMLVNILQGWPASKFHVCFGLTNWFQGSWQVKLPINQQIPVPDVPM